MIDTALPTARPSPCGRLSGSAQLLWKGWFSVTWYHCGSKLQKIEDLLTLDQNYSPESPSTHHPDTLPHMLDLHLKISIDGILFSRRHTLRVFGPGPIKKASPRNALRDRSKPMRGQKWMFQVMEKLGPLSSSNFGLLRVPFGLASFLGCHLLCSGKTLIRSVNEWNVFQIISYDNFDLTVHTTNTTTSTSECFFNLPPTALS